MRLPSDVYRNGWCFNNCGVIFVFICIHENLNELVYKNSDFEKWPKNSIQFDFMENSFFQENKYFIYTLKMST